MPEPMRGMAALLNLFDTLPKATEQEIREDLPKIGSEVLSAQRASAPSASGALRSGLTTAVLNGGWKIRIGLLDLATRVAGATKKTLGDLYYGRFVEFGRRGQTVTVQRRRRIRGRLRLDRRRRKRAEDIVATYPMKVRAKDGRPFVNGPAAETAALDGAENLADFWDKVLARRGLNNG